jgi:D-3-phosphoglycerate dehydrogenase
MPRIFLTHPPQVRASYYDALAVAGLQALAEMSFNPAGRELTTRELIDPARGCEIIVSHRGVAAGRSCFVACPTSSRSVAAPSTSET